MDVKTYIVTDDSNVVNKTLGTAIGEYSTYTFKNPTSVESPVVRIQSTDNLSGINYVYIERYGRYYFCKPVAVKNGLWELECDVDVLMSFKGQFLALTCTLERSESVYNGYLNDPEYKALAYRQTVTKAFPNAMDDDSFILITIG